MTEEYSTAYTEADERPAQLTIAGATTDPVRDYLRQIGKTPLLNAEQEVELSIDIEAGLYAAQLLMRDEVAEASQHGLLSIEEAEYLVARGDVATKQMIEANLRLVVSLAKRYTGRGMAFLDLIQEGNASLMHAIEKFDYQKGYKFSTYATWWIRQGITRAMADQARTIRLPVHMVETVNKMLRTERQMTQDLGRQPSDQEVAAELDLTPERIAELKRYIREPVSLHTPLGHGDGDGELGDLIEDDSIAGPDEAALAHIANEKLRAIIDERLTAREAGVIMRRKGLLDGREWKLEEIGAVYGVTRERIRQIEGVAMTKLRHEAVKNALR